METARKEDKMNGFMVVENEIFHNVKERKYPNGLRKITVASRNVYKEKGWELSANINQGEKQKISKPQNKDNAARNDSVRRAKQKVFDIAVMNSFDYFITLTLDEKKIDRYDISQIMQKLKTFLRNNVSRHNLKYLILPEKHKDGAIHMHGLISGNMQFVDSGTVQAAGFSKPVKLETALQKNIPVSDIHTVYNMPQWTLGFSTAIATYGDTVNCAKYITKYVTKDVQKIFGNFYYAGGDIIRDVPYSLYDLNYDEIESDKEIYCEAISTYFKFLNEQEVV